MSSVSGRNRHLESVISVLLLSTLFLIGLGVFIKQFDVDMGRFGIDTTSAGPLLEQTEPNTQEPSLDALMPDGFKKLSKTETYNSENLYEKINGKAPLYTESGFEKLFTQRFISNDDDNLWMELFVFDMAAVRNAFSIYSVQKRADAQMLTLTAPAPFYKTSNGAYFVHGQYYVELVGSTESTTLDKAMTAIAENFASRTTVDYEKIAELALFPIKDCLPGSFKLYLANAFGFDGFTDIFTCRYKLGDETITIFLSKHPNPQDAQTSTESYYNFLIENDAADKPTANTTLKDIGAKVLDFYDTTEIIFSTGPFVGGVHEAENQTAAEELATRLFDKLSNAAKTIKE
ncbi:MAG: hypothetical protein HQ580_04335 [Planctomycetes bacterium]|nr:hypothetical protein [Planctomycetota bacterium]